MSTPIDTRPKFSPAALPTCIGVHLIVIAISFVFALCKLSQGQVWEEGVPSQSPVATKGSIPHLARGTMGEYGPTVASGEIIRSDYPHCIGPSSCVCNRCGKNTYVRNLQGVDSAQCTCGAEATWRDLRPLPWQKYGAGEFVGPPRNQYPTRYRVRPGDVIDFVYRLTRAKSGHPYELEVGDQIRIEALVDENLDRDLVIQPDGTITVRLLGQVMAAGRTVDEVRKHLDKAYEDFYKVPAITVTPLVVNTRLEDLRDSVDARGGRGGQNREVTVSPDGTIQLPGVGIVPVLGLTLQEVDLEIEMRYAQIVDGLEVTPILLQRAPTFVYVVGEVGTPGRFELNGPTTAMQAIALAGSWNIGANLREVIVFRRAADWRMLATKLDLRGALYGKRPVPSDEIWLRDSDVVLVPKHPIQNANDLIEMVFTRGAYAMFPALPFSGELFGGGLIRN